MSSGGTVDRARTKGSCSTAGASKELASNAQEGTLVSNAQEGTQTSAGRGDSQLYLKVLPVTRADIEYTWPFVQLTCFLNFLLLMLGSC